MKILRIAHGLANNTIDIEVPDEFKLPDYYNTVKANDSFYSPDGLWCIPFMWIQHMCVLTREQYDALPKVTPFPPAPNLGKMN